MRAAKPGSLSPGTAAEGKAADDPQPRNAGLNALTWDYPATGRTRSRSGRNPEEINGYTVADRKRFSDIHGLKNDGSPPAAAGSTPACIRRGRNAPTSASPQISRPRLGICLAERLPHHLQPRFGAARRQAVERAQETGLVGRGKREWTGLDIRRLRQSTSRPTIPADWQTAAARGAGRRRAVHHASRRRGLAVGRQRVERRSAARALRAARVAVRQSALYAQQTNPAADRKRARPTIPTPAIARRSALSLRPHPPTA